MIKLTQQELEICYILSKVLNYFTSYNDYLQEVSESNFLKEGLFDGKYAHLKNEYWAIFLLHRKYTSVRNDILAIKHNFGQQDLDKLFCITAWYCLAHTLIGGLFDDWTLEEGWDKKEFIEGIKNIKHISYLRKKYIDFKGIIIKFYVLFLVLRNIFLQNRLDFCKRIFLYIFLHLGNGECI